MGSGKEGNKMDNFKLEQEEKLAFENDADDDDEESPSQLEVYEHFKYVEENCMFHYEDDGFPTGQYMPKCHGPETLERMLQILDDLRKDRKIRLIIDYDPDYPVAMARFWGTYLPEIQEKFDAVWGRSSPQIPPSQRREVNRMNAGNYSERITTARRKILHFIAEDETIQKMTRYEIKRAIDFVYRDISAVFDNVDLAQASSAVIAKQGSPAEPDDQESRPSSES